MTTRSGFQFNEAGTRFRVYLQPKFLTGFGTPATVHVNARPGTIEAGPRDHGIHVIDAKDKRPYKDEGTFKARWRPPFPDDGPRFPPAVPNGQGHFDGLDVRTRGFSAAMAFAVVRCVLEI